MRSRISGIALLVVAIGGLAFGAQAVMQTMIAKSDFRGFAESKVGEFLNANVEIKKVNVGFLNRIALTGLDITPNRGEDSAYRASIGAVTFRYQPLQLITQNLTQPDAVIFENPQISLPGEIFPYSLFQKLNFSSNKSDALSAVELKGGSIHYPIKRLDTALRLQEFEGRFSPSEGNRMSAEFKANMSGFMSGALSVSGEMDMQAKTHNMVITLESGSFGPKLPIPLSNISGKIRWENDNFYFEHIDADIHGWRVNISGSLRRLSSDPVLAIEIRTPKQEEDAPFRLTVDLGTKKMNGQIGTLRDQPFTFEGNIERQVKLFTISNLKAVTGHMGKGWIDFDSGQYEFDFSKERQRLSIASNLQGLEFHLELSLNHVKIYGLDLVTEMSVTLKPEESSWHNKQWNFIGQFSTGYFILEYIPLEDFKGTFEITPYGLRNLNSGWGEVFRLTGSAGFRGDDPQAKWTLKVDAFELKDIEKIANKPLPKDLSGLLEGKMKIEGPVKNPEVIGDFTIKDGVLGKLKYDWGVLRFRGFPPYLRLYESKVMKGRTNFSLEGVIDLSLSNVLHGIQVKTPEKYVIWKGYEMNTGVKDRDIELAAVSQDRTALSIKTLSSKDEPYASDRKNQEDASALVVGPKVKF